MIRSTGRKVWGYSLIVGGCALLPVAWAASKSWLLPTFTQVTGPSRYHYYYIETNHADVVAIAAIGLGMCLVLIGAWMLCRGAQSGDDE